MKTSFLSVLIFLVLCGCVTAHRTPSDLDKIAEIVLGHDLGATKGGNVIYIRGTEVAEERIFRSFPELTIKVLSVVDDSELTNLAADPKVVIRDIVRLVVDLDEAEALVRFGGGFLNYSLKRKGNSWEIVSVGGAGF
jgi:hypothetical protein